MTLAERALELWITVILIFGGYSWYFWAQRQRWFPPRYLTTRFDAMISYDPRWVFVYSGLYYPMIVLAAWSTPDWRDFAWTVGGFLALLVVQMVFFLLLPVEIPADWRVKARLAWERKHGTATWSQRCLDLVWSVDKLRNSMPSMHVSVATMVDLTIAKNWPAAGLFGAAFPLLIAMSALKTKQHYFVDVVPGAICGAAVFFAWRALAS